MAQFSPRTRTLIIGGGLAGLSLAQGLKQANIPFHIFERDTNAGFRAQGYRIRIGADGAAALKRLLPIHLYQAFVATCAPVIHGGHRLDALTGESTELELKGPPGRKDEGGPAAGPGGRMSSGEAHNADRTVLRTVLLSGLEDHISFGKRFDRYEVGLGGEVVAFFADGSSERGAFLVGADGIRSLVRKQLLPNMALLDTEGRAVFGKTPLTDELRKELPPQIDQGLSLASEKEESRMKLFCDTMQFDRDQSAEFENKLGIHMPANYIYWVLLFRKDILPPVDGESLLRLSDEQSAQKSIELTTSWHRSLRVILENQATDAASTLAFLMASLNFVDEWSAKPTDARGSVTLIGDSSHPQPPVGGVGANSGFQDSADLCDALVSLRYSSEKTEREERISVCENKILNRAKAAVERSSVGAGHFFDMKSVDELKPVASWH